VGLRGGIDLGGTKIQTVVIDDVHTVLGKARCATPTKGGPPDVAAAIASAMRDAAEAAGVTTSELAHVGVGSPGEIGSASGTVTSARNLPGWEGSYPLAAVLEDDLDAPVSLGNDVQVATDAEAHLGWSGRPPIEPERTSVSDL
jgi:glucokinase